MLKRLLILITVVSMLGVFTIAQAQEPLVSSQPTAAQVQLNTSNPVSTQIIMKDGNICSPRLGCW